jgi:hypothetical protein
MDISDQLHIPVVLPRGVRASGTHEIGGWVGRRAGLDAVAKRIDPTIAPVRN